jgi:hypothetical protein
MPAVFLPVWLGVLPTWWVRNVDIIVVDGSASARAAKAATIAIPVVFSLATDPEAEGPVSSIARPGANLTGLTMSAGYSWPARPAEHA